MQEFPSVHQIRQKKTAIKCFVGCLVACHTDFVFAEPSRLCFPSARPVVVVHRWGKSPASGHRELTANVHLAGNIKRVGMTRSGSGCCLGV